MKICIIATKLFNGGFTSSMINMIQCLPSYIKVDVLFLEPENHEIDVKTIKELKALNRIKTKKYMKVIFFKFDDLKSEIFSVIFRGTKEKSNTMENATKKLKKYIKYCFDSIDLSDYASVISWEELACNIFLTEKVIAKRKIGYIHPDYISAGFSKKEDYITLSKLDKIICVSESTKRTLSLIFPEFYEKIFCVPNPINISRINRLSMEKNPLKNEFNIITVCRLDNKSKALDRLIRIVAKLNDKNFKYTWNIVGDGPYKNELYKSISKMKIKNIVLWGNQDNPYPFIRNSDLFVLQSYYEGRPVVIDESLLLETPVLVTNYASAKEQVNSMYGYVVENNEEAIYEKIKEIFLNRLSLNEKKSNLELMNKNTFLDVSKFLEVIQ